MQIGRYSILGLLAGVGLTTVGLVAGIENETKAPRASTMFPARLRD